MAFNLDTFSGGILARPRETFVGQVIPGHVPTLLRQEYRVSSLPHAYIERLARR